MSRKLLLADASTAIQRVVALTFAGEDVQVVAVSDGEQAIARIPIERPDVVLANIGTAKRSGYDVAAFVKTHPDLSHVPVLLLASAFEPVDEERARQVKSAGVLVKPFDPQQVIARVRDLVPLSTPQLPVAAAAIPASSGTASVEIARTESPAPEAPVPTLESGASVLSSTPRLPDSTGPEFRTPSSGSPISIPEPRIPSPGSPVPNPGSLIPHPESRIPSPGPQVPNPGSHVSTGSLDDYFDRLDAALTSRSASRQAAAGVPQPGAADDEADVNVPSIDDVLGPEPTTARTTTASTPESRVPESQSPSPPPIAITDELVDRIAQKVVDRLSGEAAKQLLAGLVGRLVREETNAEKAPLPADRE